MLQGAELGRGGHCRIAGNLPAIRSPAAPSFSFFGEVRRYCGRPTDVEQCVQSIADVGDQSPCVRNIEFIQLERSKMGRDPLTPDLGPMGGRIRAKDQAWRGANQDCRLKPHIVLDIVEIGVKQLVAGGVCRSCGLGFVAVRTIGYGHPRSAPAFGLHLERRKGRCG